MCSSDLRIDPCMRTFIKQLNGSLHNHLKILACCCGHNKYPMSIIITNGIIIWDLVSGVEIPRKIKFYKRDKQGYYFIPEISNFINKDKEMEKVFGELQEKFDMKREGLDLDKFEEVKTRWLT